VHNEGKKSKNQGIYLLCSWKDLITCLTTRKNTL
jgi:hypothetical protein